MSFFSNRPPTSDDQRLVDDSLSDVAGAINDQLDGGIASGDVIDVDSLEIGDSLEGTKRRRSSPARIAIAGGIVLVGAAAFAMITGLVPGIDPNTFNGGKPQASQTPNPVTAQAQEAIPAPAPVAASLPSMPDPAQAAIPVQQEKIPAVTEPPTPATAPAAQPVVPNVQLPAGLAPTAPVASPTPAAAPQQPPAQVAAAVPAPQPQVQPAAASNPVAAQIAVAESIKPTAPANQPAAVALPAKIQEPAIQRAQEPTPAPKVAKVEAPAPAKPAPAPKVAKVESSPVETEQKPAVRKPAPSKAPVASHASEPAPSKAESHASSTGESQSAIRKLVQTTPAKMGIRSIQPEGLIFEGNRSGDRSVYQIGDQLPNGEKLQRIDAANNTIVTDKSVFRIQ